MTMAKNLLLASFLVLVPALALNDQLKVVDRTLAEKTSPPTPSPTEAQELNLGLGYVCCLISVLGFGSNFIPAKRVDTGDGFYFQWVMCCAIWMVSVLTQIALGNPKFEPFAMLGGFLWCTGNALCLIVIQYVGMGIGLLVWGSTNMLMGWASGTFGFFGIEKSEISNPALNFVGVAIAVFATLLYMRVETESSPPAQPGSITQRDSALRSPFLEEGNSNRSLVMTGKDVSENDEKENDGSKKTIGIVLALTAGALFGFNFDPVEYLKAHDDSFGGDHSPNSIDYVFSHFTGIFFTSTCYMIIHCSYKAHHGQLPVISPSVTLPAFLTGAVWAIADISWFVANDNLSLSVSFPVITSGPGLVGAMWGVFLFGEIKGSKNLIRLAVACFTTVLAVSLIAASK